jgi:hypothetical protein
MDKTPRAQAQEASRLSAGCADLKGQLATWRSAAEAAVSRAEQAEAPGCVEHGWHGWGLGSKYVQIFESLMDWLKISLDHFGSVWIMLDHFGCLD